MHIWLWVHAHAFEKPVHYEEFALLNYQLAICSRRLCGRCVALIAGFAEVSTDQRYSPITFKMTQFTQLFISYHFLFNLLIIRF